MRAELITRREDACDALDRQAKMSCATCKHSRAEEHLYACYNTEINITSNQTDKFYCAKWEEEENIKA